MFRYQINGPIKLKIWKSWPPEWVKEQVNRLAVTWDHEAKFWLRTRCEIGREGPQGIPAQCSSLWWLEGWYLRPSDTKWTNWLGETAVAPKKRVPHGDKTPNYSRQCCGVGAVVTHFSVEKLKERWVAEFTCSSYKALSTEPWTQVKQPRFHF